MRLDGGGVSVTADCGGDVRDIAAMWVLSVFWAGGLQPHNKSCGCDGVV